MLDLPKQAQYGLQQLSKDIQNLLKKNKQPPEGVPHTIQDSTETDIGKNPVFINNNYYQPRPAVTPTIHQRKSILGFIKISIMCMFLGGCIAIGLMLVVSPEMFIDKLESTGEFMLRFLRSLFVR